MLYYLCEGIQKYTDGENSINSKLDIPNYIITINSKNIVIKNNIEEIVFEKTFSSDVYCCRFTELNKLIIIYGKIIHIYNKNFKLTNIINDFNTDDYTEAPDLFTYLTFNKMETRLAFIAEDDDLLCIYDLKLKKLKSENTFGSNIIGWVKNNSICLYDDSNNLCKVLITRSENDFTIKHLKYKCNIDEEDVDCFDDLYYYGILDNNSIYLIICDKILIFDSTLKNKYIINLDAIFINNIYIINNNLIFTSKNCVYRYDLLNFNLITIDENCTDFKFIPNTYVNLW